MRQQFLDDGVANDTGKVAVRKSRAVICAEGRRPCSPAAKHGAQRHDAAAQGLRHQNDIGLYSGFTLEAEHSSGTAKAALNFIQHHQGSGFLAQRACRRKISVRLDPHAALTLDRFDHEGGDVFFSQPVGEAIQIAKRQYFELACVVCLRSSDLEAVVIPRYPVLAEMKELLSRSGALGTLMSGSGPTVFGLFESRESRDRGYEKVLQEKDPRWWVCRTGSI